MDLFNKIKPTTCHCTGKKLCHECFSEKFLEFFTETMFKNTYVWMLFNVTISYQTSLSALQLLSKYLLQ